MNDSSYQVTDIYIHCHFEKFFLKNGAKPYPFLIIRHFNSQQFKGQSCMAFNQGITNNWNQKIFMVIFLPSDFFFLSIMRKLSEETLIKKGSSMLCCACSVLLNSQGFTHHVCSLLYGRKKTTRNDDATKPDEVIKQYHARGSAVILNIITGVMRSWARSCSIKMFGHIYAFIWYITVV